MMCVSVGWCVCGVFAVSVFVVCFGVCVWCVSGVCVVCVVMCFLRDVCVVSFVCLLCSL